MQKVTRALCCRAGMAWVVVMCLFFAGCDPDGFALGSGHFQVHRGMTGQQVAQILGPNKGIGLAQEGTWQYSLDSQGRVTPACPAGVPQERVCLTISLLRGVVYDVQMH